MAEAAVASNVLPLLARWVTATLLTAVATLWIAMAEIDRLIAGLVNSDGRNSSIAILSGFGGGGAADTWKTWSGLDPDSRLSDLSVLVNVHTWLDFIFAVLYGYLLWRLVRGFRLARLAVVAAVALDILEGFLIRWCIADLAGGQPAAAGFLGFTSSAKWAMLTLVLVCCLASPRIRRRSARRALLLWQVLWFHRLSAAAVALVAVLALLPIPGVSDQMPDSQRQWATSEGLPPFVFNSAAVVLVAVALFVLGRMRSGLAWELWKNGWVPGLPPRRFVWCIGPLVLLVGLAVSALSGLAARTSWAQFWLFLLVPLAILGVSLVIRAVSFVWAPSDFWELKPKPKNRRKAVAMWRGADNLAALLFVVAGMALVRSFTAPVATLVLPREVAAGPALPAWALPAAGLLAFGVLLALGVYPIKSLLLRKTLWLLKPDPASGFSKAPMRLRYVAGLGAAALLWQLIWPQQATEILGVSATAVLGIGSWAIVLGATIVWMQGRQPLELFHRMGYRANPVLSLLILALAIGQALGGTNAMHLPRQHAAQQAGERNTLEDEFQSWLRASAACDRPVPGTDKRVRPMLVVASEGGGIRATSWTTKVFDTLAKTECGRAATILSSGISGGSLGLALVTAYAPRSGSVRQQPGAGAQPTTPDAAADRVAEPEALSASVGGTMVTDAVAGGTGLLLPNISHGEATWHDRAGLMEKQWENRAPLLGLPFDYSARGAAGAILLNSTVTGSGCRLVLSQVRLPAASPVTATPPGCVTSGSAPVSIDFFGTTGEEGREAGLGNIFCDTDVAWSTAAMLSARFPIISPAGRVTYPTDVEACPAAGEQRADSLDAFQAIDGGYAEGSGLGTVSDIWGRLRTIVMEHNESVEVPLGTGTGAPATEDGAPSSYVVPIFLYVRNSPGSDVTAQVPETISELAVPIAGIKAKNVQSEAQAWLQRLDQSAEVCLGTQCRDATVALLGSPDSVGTLVGRTVAAAPDSEPAIDPPLGWTLSVMSRERLDAALAVESAPCRATVPAARCQAFGKLLGLLKTE